MEISDETARRSLQRRSRGKGNRWSQLLAITDGLCFYCGVELHKSIRTRDHVHPRAYGGKGKRYNLVPACASCNCTKGKKSIAVFRRDTIGNQWFHGERREIERMVDIGAIDRGIALEMLEAGPLGGHDEQ